MLKKRTKDSVVEVYRKMLTGEKLDDIKADDCIKEMVRTFLRHSNLSAYQIAQTTDLTSDVVGALRDHNGFSIVVQKVTTTSGRVIYITYILKAVYIVSCTLLKLSF